MNMTHCPQCQHQREGEEYKCPKCDCFYSALDEMLATEADEIKKRSFIGRLQAIKTASNSIEALKNEYQRLEDSTPYSTILALGVIFMFIFALIISVM
jgi:predicted ATP-dependent serine protease